jgi:polysaccharide biosynthesis/export protein
MQMDAARKLNNSKMSIVKYALALTAILALNIGWAQNAGQRLGLLYPDEQQRLKAVQAAPSGQDEALEEPASLVFEDKVNEKSLRDLFLKLTQGLPLGDKIVIQPENNATPKNINESLSADTLKEQKKERKIEGEIQLFGYDIFQKTPTTFAPVENIPVPSDYVIGPGDTFKVQIFGPVDVEYSLVVTRDGRILVPEIGDLQVGGMTFEEAKYIINEKAVKLRIGVKTAITLSNLQTIQITVVGEVEKPGLYTISGLSSLINSIIITGGVKQTGSLRNIQLKRGQRVIATLDMYDVLIKGHTKENIYLRHGDVIVVPPIGRTTGIAGEVVRPAIYELKSEQNIRDLITLAGGLLATAAPKKAQIKRVNRLTDRFELIQVDLNKSGADQKIANGDVVRIFPVNAKIDNAIILKGNILEPGSSEWKKGLKVFDLITENSLRLNTDMTTAAIVREDNTGKSKEIIYINLAKELKSKATSTLLQSRDEIIVFSTHDPRSAILAEIVQQFKLQATQTSPPNTVELKGHFKHEGVYPFQKNAKLLDLIHISGGLQIGTDKKYALLFRRNSIDGSYFPIHIHLQEALNNVNSDNNLIIQPLDRLYVFDGQINRAEMLRPEIDLIIKQATSLQPSKIVEVKGPVFHPGRYPLTPGMSVQTLIDAAGGLKEQAYTEFATLTRDSLIQGQYSTTNNLIVNLLNFDAEHNLSSRLHPADYLVIREKPEWNKASDTVTITGEVKYPGTYKIGKRETICAFVKRVGGFNDDAYLFGTVFLRESVRRREQEAMTKIFNEMDDLLAEVHLSPGYDKDKKMPLNKETYDIYKVIKALKPNKAVGRMVVDMNKAAKDCNPDFDFVLQDMDKIHVPTYMDEVSVVGQVYMPSSHQFRKDRGALDYINLSGGTKELAQREHAFVIQANGEVISVRSAASTWGWLSSPKNFQTTPGSTIVVPLSVDRINGREFSQSWIDMIYKISISAASTAFLFN